MTEETQQSDTPAQIELCINTPDTIKLKDNKREKCRPMTKVVIRRLPPSMTQEQFIEQISPLPEHDYLYFVKADMYLGQYAFSRAYINFLDQQDIFIFREKFDNYVFVDSKGTEYPAVVEFAPFQRLPKKRIGKKKDLKCGTLESDPYYINFLESLKNQDTDSGLSQPKTEYSYQPSDNTQKKVTTTPLLEYLKQRKQEKQRLRDEKREERRRRDLERRRAKDEPMISKPMYNNEDLQSEYSFLPVSSNPKLKHTSSKCPSEGLDNCLKTCSKSTEEICLNNFTVMMKMNKNSTNLSEQPYESTHFTEIYMKDQTVAHIRRYESNDTRQFGLRKLFDYRDKDYKREDFNYKRNGHDHHYWLQYKNNYVYRKNKTRFIQSVDKHEYFPALPKSQSTNLREIWKSQTPNGLLKSKSCSAVPDCDKICPFKTTIKTGLPKFRKNS